MTRGLFRCQTPARQQQQRQAGAPRSRRRPRTHAPAGNPPGRPRRGRRRGDPAAPGSRREAEPAARALARLAVRTPRPPEAGREGAGRRGSARPPPPRPRVVR